MCCLLDALSDSRGLEVSRGDLEQRRHCLTGVYGARLGRDVGRAAALGQPMQREHSAGSRGVVEAGCGGCDLAVTTGELVVLANRSGMTPPQDCHFPRGFEACPRDLLGCLARGRHLGGGLGPMAGDAQQGGTPLGGLLGVVGQGDASCLAHPVDERADHPVVVVAALAQVEPPVAEPALDLLEPLGAEELLEQPVPILGGCAKERLEAALRQHRHLGELREVHAHQRGHQVTGLVEPRGEGHPGAVGAFADHYRGLLLSGAGTALLGARPGRGADDAEPPAGEGRVELHAGWCVGGSLVGPQPPGVVALAGDRAVKGEAHGVEHAGLAGPGGSRQQEQTGCAQGVEVDRRGVGERTERRHRQAVQPHPAPAAAESRVSTSMSSQHASQAS